MPHPVQSLPRIIRFDGVTDSGEYGNANCPHCDAKGRYVYHFVTEDGAHRGAMAGCIKLFPVAPIAKEHKTLLEKAVKLSQQTWPDGRTKTLNTWDTRKLEAIEQFYSGDISEDDAQRVITSQNQSRADWMRKKGYRR